MGILHTETNKEKMKPMSHTTFGVTKTEVYDARLDKERQPYLVTLPPQGYNATKEEIIAKLQEYNNNLSINYDFIKFKISDDKGNFPSCRITQNTENDKIKEVIIGINRDAKRNYLVNEEIKIGIDMLINKLDVLTYKYSSNIVKFHDIFDVMNVFNDTFKHIKIVDCTQKLEDGFNMKYLYCKINAGEEIVNEIKENIRAKLFCATEKYPNICQYINLRDCHLIEVDCQIDELINATSDKIDNMDVEDKIDNIDVEDNNNDDSNACNCILLGGATYSHRCPTKKTITFKDVVDKIRDMCESGEMTNETLMSIISSCILHGDNITMLELLSIYHKGESNERKLESIKAINDA